MAKVVKQAAAKVAKKTVNLCVLGRESYNELHVYEGNAEVVTTTTTNAAGKVLSTSKELKPTGKYLTRLCRDGFKSVFGFVPANGEYVNFTLTGGTRIKKQ